MKLKPAKKRRPLVLKKRREKACWSVAQVGTSAGCKYVTLRWFLAYAICPIVM